MSSSPRAHALPTGHGRSYFIGSRSGGGEGAGFSWVPGTVLIPPDCNARCSVSVHGPPPPSSIEVSWAALPQVACRAEVSGAVVLHQDL